MALLCEQLLSASAAHSRYIVGLAGEPGAGKSTLAAALADRLGPIAAVVPFDGFHLANSLLQGTPRQRSKGAIDTFDLAGYRSLVQRLRSQEDAVVYAPAYLRELEEPVAASIAIPHSVRIVITEGNYLLDEQPDLACARAAMDETWYVEIAEAERLRRLIARHIEFGKTPAQAAEWATRSDAANAMLIRRNRALADFVVLNPV